MTSGRPEDFKARVFASSYGDAMVTRTRAQHLTAERSGPLLGDTYSDFVLMGFVLEGSVSVPLDGTSVNPARSLGPAVFAGGEALAHVWAFIVAPLVGGALAALVVPFVETRSQDDGVDRTGADVPG